MGSSALRVVDKMPENTLYLGWIATLFPLAILIHCRRDLRDVGMFVLDDPHGACSLGL